MKQIFFQRGNMNGQQVYGKVLSTTSLQGTTNQNHNEIITSPLLGQPLSKSQGISVGENVEKRELLDTIGVNVNW